MPPALVNESDDSAQEVKVKPKKTSAKQQIEEELESAAEQNGDEDMADAGEDDEEEGDDDDDDGEAYVVEKILDHICDPPGPTLYCVKWQGYDDKKDLTWEPKDNLMT